MQIQRYVVQQSSVGLTSNWQTNPDVLLREDILSFG